MTEALWALVREYIAAESALVLHRMQWGVKVATPEELKRLMPTLYDEEQVDVTDYEGRIELEKETCTERQVQAQTKRAELEEQSTRMETALLQACRAFEGRLENLEERVKEAQSTANRANSYHVRY